MNDGTQSDLRRWLRSIVESTGRSPSQLAREAGISHTTVTRMLDPDYSGSMNASTIAKIARVAGVAAPGALAPAVPAGFSEPEIEKLDIAPPPEVSLSPDQSIWTVRGHALILAGYLPGDRVVIDMSVSPCAGDIVVAQHYDDDAGTARTILRRFRPPELVTASTPDRAAQTLRVDNDQVRIMGVVVRMWREREQSAAD